MAKKDISREIFDFFQFWTVQDTTSFLEDVMLIFEMFQEEEDPIIDPADEEDAKNTKLVRYVYLMSYLAETYAGKFARIKMEHKNLWKRLGKIAEEEGKNKDAS